MATFFKLKSPCMSKARFIMLRIPSTGMVIMAKVNDHDVFFSDRGLITRRRLNWNVTFFKLLKATLKDGIVDLVSRDELVPMVKNIHDHVQTRGGRVFCKITNTKFAAWETVSMKKAYSLIARSLIALAHKNNIRIDLRMTGEKRGLIVGISRLTMSDDGDQQATRADDDDALVASDNAAGAKDQISAACASTDESASGNHFVDEKRPVVAYRTTPTKPRNKGDDGVTDEWIKEHTTSILRRISENQRSQFGST